jgi:hypothetical protein
MVRTLFTLLYQRINPRNTLNAYAGAPAQQAAIFDKSDVLFSPSSLNTLEFYHSSDETSTTTFSSRKLPCKVRCNRCHTPLMDEGRRMCLIFPGLINWKDGEEGAREKEKFRPRCIDPMTRY